ncbi:MAG: DUF2851 family protein [Bacteroidaceae bacterium]|nr:DUF2851 family protein [Bacteroidaceae bacterium]
MEQLLHYVWKHRLFPLEPLVTTDGQVVEVIDVGLHNTNAGPDFFNAKVKIGGVLWVGNVEIHMRASDWRRHGHPNDAAYNNVVLHVVENADEQALTSCGDRPPTLVLPIPESVERNYAQLSMTEDYPRCWPIIPQVSALTVHSWMSALLCERLEQRAGRCINWLKSVEGDWERTLFIALARNFGFGVNGDAFEMWGSRMPLYAAAKHRDNLFQLEALFLGSAGLLNADAVSPSMRETARADAYLIGLQKEWNYLKHKFQLPDEMDYNMWRYLRLRPQNFPHLRIAQLAYLYHRRTADFAHLLKANTREDIHAALDTDTSDYWQAHYLFGQPAQKPVSRHLSAATRDLVIVNTVCPMLFAHGKEHNNEDETAKALSLLETLRAERNNILRLWQRCGIRVETAADSQALIQLKREYCDKHECLRCRFGYEYMKRT